MSRSKSLKSSRSGTTQNRTIYDQSLLRLDAGALGRELGTVERPRPRAHGALCGALTGAQCSVATAAITHSTLNVMEEAVKLRDCGPLYEPEYIRQRVICLGKIHSIGKPDEVGILPYEHPL